MKELFNVKDLSLTFGKHTIYDHVDFSIAQGQHTALKGHSGSGKSILLKILCGLQRFDDGEITFEGKPLYDYDYRELRQRVAYVTQTPQLFGHTVRENLYFPFEIRGQAVDDEAIDHLMRALNMENISLDTDISTLSGGERQRVGLIRSLVTPSHVLLLDEITSALDKKNQRAVEKVLQDFADQNGTTLIWIAHHAIEITDPKQTIMVNGDGSITVTEGAVPDFDEDDAALDASTEAKTSEESEVTVNG